MDDIYALLLYLVFRETLSVSHSNKHPIYLSAQNHYWCWDSIKNQWYVKESKYILYVLEINPCGLGSSIRVVEAFWYKKEIKIIYFVQLCLIVWFTLTLNFWYVKLKNGLIFFLWLEADFFWSHVITQNICNKFIKIEFSVGCMVWVWCWLWQHSNYT